MQPYLKVWSPLSFTLKMNLCPLSTNSYQSFLSKLQVETGTHRRLALNLSMRWRQRWLTVWFHTESRSWRHSRRHECIKWNLSEKPLSGLSSYSKKSSRHWMRRNLPLLMSYQKQVKEPLYESRNLPSEPTTRAIWNPLVSLTKLTSYRARHPDLAQTVDKAWDKLMTAKYLQQSDENLRISATAKVRLMSRCLNQQVVEVVAINQQWRTTHILIYPSSCNPVVRKSPLQLSNVVRKK